MAPKTPGARTLSVSGRTVVSSLVAFLVTSLTASPFNVCGNNGWGYVCQALIASVGRQRRSLRVGDVLDGTEVAASQTTTVGTSRDVNGSEAFRLVTRRCGRGWINIGRWSESRLGS